MPSPNCAIDGGADRHFEARYGGSIATSGRTVTFRANCAFANGFADCRRVSVIRAFSMTFTLGGFSVTGKRYNVDLNGVIETAGGGASYFPGDSAGTTATGGRIRMRDYDPQDHYWIVGGDETRAWSSASGDYVAAGDKVYAAWRDAGGATTRIASEAEL